MIYPINHLPEVIPVGIQTEQGVEVIGFDLKPWLDALPDMAFSVWHTRPGEEDAYPVNDHMMIGTVLYWHPDGYDTAIAGDGRVEIAGVGDNHRKLSGFVKTSIRATSLGTTKEPGENAAPWYEAVLQAAQDVKADVDVGESGLFLVRAVGPEEYAPTTDRTIDEIRAAVAEGKTVFAIDKDGVVYSYAGDYGEYANDEPCPKFFSHVKYSYGKLQYKGAEIRADNRLNRIGNAGMKTPAPYALNIAGKTYDGSKAVSVLPAPSDASSTAYIRWNGTGYAPATVDSVKAELGAGGTVEVDVTLTKANAAADAKVVGDRFTSLSEEIAELDKQCYSISEYPIFIDPKDYETSGAFSRFQLLDVHHYALCNQYTANTFYKVDPITLKDELLCEYAPVTEVSNMQWECGKIFPLARADYDYMLLWSKYNKKMYVCATNGVAVKTLDNQKLGWLKNTGIDIAYSSIGCVSANGTIIYAEYYLPEYVDSSNPPTTINVWRSTNWGKDWASVFQQNTRIHDNPDIYHFHFVRHDPYNAGHWYLGSGDNPSESNIWRSTDDGLTWTNINDPAFSGGLQSVHRSCNLYFTEDYIYWGTDDSVTAMGQGNGGKWVRSPRNLESNQLEIEVLADLKDWARIIMPTPYGVLITTEARFSEYGYVWMAPYEDLVKPVLVAKIKGGTGVYQLQANAYGSRLFMRDADSARDNKLYPTYPLPAMASVMDVSMVSRP